MNQFVEAQHSIRLLCTGDLHLGRSPSRVPMEDRSLSVEHVWQQTISYAIDQKVDALVLTGDVVDADNRFFEAFGPLQRGLTRLSEARIPTYAVAGNHDYDVLPRLHELLESGLVHLMGWGGQWTTAPLVRDGETVLRFAGWSFPTRHVTASPLSEFPDLETDVPTIGILHAELDNPTSTYNPVRRQELQEKPVSAWLLGHIHRPAVHEHQEQCILYPGSPQPLDPGEEGAHGPWLVSVEPSGRARAEQLPLATLRYDSLDVDLTGVDADDAFQQKVVASVADDLAGTTAAQSELRRVVYCLRYIGRTALHRRVEALNEQIVTDLQVLSGAVTAVVDQFDVQTRPKLDLEQLARAADPPGVLAGLLLEIQRDGTLGDDALSLLRLMADDCVGVHRAAAYAALRSGNRPTGAPDAAQMRALAIRQGLLLLDEMMVQTRETIPAT